jgi:plasmid stability protein
MADVRVRNLDDKVVGELKDRARHHGRSLEAELRQLLTDEAFRPRREVAERLDAFRERLRAEFGILPDSTAGIRAWRDGVE